MDDTATATADQATIEVAEGSDDVSVMVAPASVSSASVDGTEYTVVDGCISVQNPAHVEDLIRHGFTHPEPTVTHSEPVLTHSEPEKDEDEPDPEFGTMTRDKIVEWLGANGVPDAKADSPKADLVSAAEGRLAEIKAAAQA